jgi:NADPH:quinone reductase-like Zn-dependent oxidoreductase
MLLSPFVSQTLRALISSDNSTDLQVLTGLLETGKVRPVIDKTYSHADVPEAIHYLEQGHARGKVVITV